MMRRLLVLLALLELLYSPAAAVAAQQTCADSGMPMAGMAAASSGDGGATADPCCDHKSKAPDNKACAQACAVMCGVVGALPAALLFVPPQIEGQPAAEASLPLKPHPPPRADRPPRSIA